MDKGILFFINQRKPLKTINIYRTCNCASCVYIKEDTDMIKNLNTKGNTIGKNLQKFKSNIQFTFDREMTFQG